MPREVRGVKTERGHVLQGELGTWKAEDEKELKADQRVVVSLGPMVHVVLCPFLAPTYLACCPAHRSLSTNTLN